MKERKEGIREKRNRKIQIEGEESRERGEAEGTPRGGVNRCTANLMN